MPLNRNSVLHEGTASYTAPHDRPDAHPGRTTDRHRGGVGARHGRGRPRPGLPRRRGRRPVGDLRTGPAQPARRAARGRPARAGPARRHARRVRAVGGRRPGGGARRRTRGGHRAPRARPRPGAGPHPAGAVRQPAAAVGARRPPGGPAPGDPAGTRALPRAAADAPPAARRTAARAGAAARRHDPDLPPRRGRRGVAGGERGGLRPPPRAGLAHPARPAGTAGPAVVRPGGLLPRRARRPDHRLPLDEGRTPPSSSARSTWSASCPTNRGPDSAGH